MINYFKSVEDLEEKIPYWKNLSTCLQLSKVHFSQNKVKYIIRIKSRYNIYSKCNILSSLIEFKQFFFLIIKIEFKQLVV